MSNNILITPGSASIEFSGSTDNIIRLQVQPLGQVDFISQSVSLVSIGNAGIVTTGSITVTQGGFTGSLLGTASLAQTASFFTGSISFPSGLIVTGSILANTVSASSFLGTASFATTASFAVTSSRAVTSSFTFSSSLAQSAILAQTASFFDGFITFPSGLDITGSLIVTGSQTTNGVQIISGSITSSGQQHGILLQSGSNTLSITYPAGGSGGSNWLYGAVNSAHVFRINSTDAIIVDSSGMGPVTTNAYTLGGATNRFSSAHINSIVSSGSITNTGSLSILSGSINITNGGVTSSLFGTSSNATSASFAISASWAPSAPGGGVTSITAGNGLTGGEITSTGTITIDTGSVHFLDGVKKELNTEGVISSSGQVSYTGLSNVPANIISSSAQVTAFLPAGTVSSSTQVNYTQLQNIPAGIVSSSTFSSPSQGTVRAVINGIQTDVDTGLQTGDSPQFTNLNVSSAITASIVSASTSVTASRVQLNGLTDTTATNKILVVNTATNQIFTTASILPNGLISSSQQFNSLTAPFTGSFTGSFTGALTHFSPSTVKITVGTTAPSSPAINDLWVDTN